ncbi:MULTISPECIES: hypothetical protein [unclassified Corynebacterium]|nr:MULTISPECIES: hypothetical protein [unclassified Corynebacterium]
MATRSEFVDRELPQGWQGSLTITIALAGARASGKTLYIAVLLKVLEQMIENYGQVLRPADASTAESYAHNYEDPLYRKMGLPNSTPSINSGDAYQHDPLIFDIGKWDIQGEQRQVFLVLRDVAGEDLEVLPKENLAQLEFFQYAHEIIFLFDPLTVEEIQKMLRGKVHVESADEEPTKNVLDNLLYLMNGTRTRLAVTLSKFDTLRQLEEIQGLDWAEIMGNYGAAFNRELDPPYTGTDQVLLHNEISSLLVRLDAKRLINTLTSQGFDQGSQLRFFAVSSLGNNPHGSHLDRSGIAPFRCADPVLWLLYDYNILTGGK